MRRHKRSPLLGPSISHASVFLAFFLAFDASIGRSSRLSGPLPRPDAHVVFAGSAQQQAPPPPPGVEPAIEVGSLAVFPFCSCTDYKCTSNPYRLVFGGIQPMSNYTNVCFTINYVRVFACIELILPNNELF